jgi:hypothetical protein
MLLEIISWNDHGFTVSIKLVLQFGGKGTGNHRMEIKDLSVELYVN